MSTRIQLTLGFVLTPKRGINWTDALRALPPKTGHKSLGLRLSTYL
jgi:hypothetical protein